MQKDTPIIVTASFQPLLGKESEVEKFLDDKIRGLAYSNRANWVGIYFKKTAKTYIVTVHFSNEQTANRFLTSEEFDKFGKEMQGLCSAPFNKEVFEVIIEEAA